MNSNWHIVVTVNLYGEDRHKNVVVNQSLQFALENRCLQRGRKAWGPNASVPVQLNIVDERLVNRLIA